ncbi:hypothetical protein GALMADRAFT_209058 [Galerina marginata CBS 339.88]|uniref:Uncharacterized protein n=1 Tax=Galerina marginata (strain CBS 339.88) TaxID=685588 RepID=A0A067T600_GALM3|nr:hypothetical protein GALMADRAFT_209058 [Galerina marginata CBS 339.88]
MVQITASHIVALIFVVPALAVPFNGEQSQEIDAREPNELARRRIHIHVPKVHVNTKLLKKIVGGLKKFGPMALKMAKMVLREDIEARSPSLAARDMDSMDELHDLLARSPRGSLMKLMKTAKTMKKYAKKYRKYGKFALEAGGVYGRALEDFEVDSRELVEPLELLERAVNAELYDRDLNDDFEVYERDGNLDSYSEGLLGRDYEEFGLDELD